MLKIQNLSHKYGSKWVLKDLDIHLKKPQLCALLGRNGAGKSTTLKCIAGLITPTQGHIWIHSDLVCSWKQQVSQSYKSSFGYLPEKSPLYPEMTVKGYLEWIGRVRRLKSRELKTRINELSELCDLSSFLYRRIFQLSKGMQHRVGLAQALIHSPSILLLDEMYSGLDPYQVDEIQRLLLTLKKSTCILLSTHQLNRAQEIADQIVILEEGQVCGQGSIHDLTSSLNQKGYLLTFKSPLSIDHPFPSDLISCLHLQKTSGVYYSYWFKGNQEQIERLLFFVNQSTDLSLIELRPDYSSLDEIYRLWTTQNELD